MPQTNEIYPPQRFEEDDEIDLLDVLATMAENLKLLIFGPLIAAAIAWAIAYQVPPVYESISVVRSAELNTQERIAIIAPPRSNPQVIAQMALSSDVLIPVGQTLGIPARAAVGRQDNLVTLTTSASTPEQAQQLNRAIWDQVFPLTQPSTEHKEQLQTQLQILQKGLTASAALEQATAQQLASGQITEVAARLYADIQSANAQRIRDIAHLQAELDGLTAANFIQQATLPTAPRKSRKALITAVTALGTGMVLLVFIFTRQALRNANHNPQQAQSLGRLRAALGLNAASDKPREDR